MKKLTQKFFERSPQVVAKELLGKYLVRKVRGKIIRDKIIETESYGGPKDLASHARFGRTKRNAAMHMEGGVIYVYFVYGMHNMLNIVTGKKEHPSAVLIRGTEKFSGPGRVAKAFKINRDLYGKKLSFENGLWIEGGEKVNPKNILKTGRIGVEYAGAWAKKPYRFLLK